jgi:hypothetical protein
MGTYDRTSEDTGNVLSLDHLNLTIADQQQATLFYIVGMGFSRDPYMMVGLENMWVNAGRQQFHVPTRPASPQVMRGRIGIVVPDVAELLARLGGVADQLKDTQFAYKEHGDHVGVTCPWGNEFIVTGPVEGFRASFGVPYVEFAVPEGAGSGIARFYDEILGARVDLADVRKSPAALVQTGVDQSMIFREDGEASARDYDGHHIAVYLADFSGPHAALDARGLVSEESNAHQYRFKDIVDLETGTVLYELEHEVRSMGHPMYGRALVNRDPNANLGNYRRGAEFLNVG